MDEIFVVEADNTNRKLIPLLGKLFLVSTHLIPETTEMVTPQLNGRVIIIPYYREGAASVPGLVSLAIDDECTPAVAFANANEATGYLVSRREVSNFNFVGRHEWDALNKTTGRRTTT